jgi:thiol-disulfide isomerase/thioredoxin
VVLLFVGTDCPISNKYIPEVERLVKEFNRQGIKFYAVYAGEVEPEAIKKHLKEFGVTLAALRDPELKLARFARAKITPEAVVFVGERKVVYRGRIDNRFPELGRARVEATERDLRDVLKAIVAGKPVPEKNTPAIGCYIPGLK